MREQVAQSKEDRVIPAMHIPLGGDALSVAIKDSAARAGNVALAIDGTGHPNQLQRTVPVARTPALAVGLFQSLQLKSEHGHSVVRVAPGGASYRVIILDDAAETFRITAIHGPYESR